LFLRQFIGEINSKSNTVSWLLQVFPIYFTATFALSSICHLASVDTSRGLRILYPVHTGYAWDTYPESLFKSGYGVAGYVYLVRLGWLWIRPSRVFGPFSPCTVYPKPSIRVFLFHVTQAPPLYERMKPPSWRRRLPRSSPLPLSPLGELSTAAASPRWGQRPPLPPPLFPTWVIPSSLPPTCSCLLPPGLY
jgi:hypothetical protein